MNAKGSVIKLGDNIDTDLIIAARYLSTADPVELAEHFMEDYDPEIIKKINHGDIIVAGKNFGCGSSREHAPIAIKASGISVVIAESFARIFYRNAFNTGLPIVESKEASQGIGQGDEISVDFSKGVIKNITKDEEYKIQAYPEFIQKIIASNGLINYVSKRIGEKDEI